MRNWFIAAVICCCCAKGLAQEVTKMEYFFDTDPGAGKATPVVITGADTLRTIKNISTQGLAAGAHTLYVRVSNLNGWSQAESYPIILQHAAAGINSAEYFYDTDPGQGKAIPLLLGTAKDTMRVTKNLPVTGLPEGYHVLYTRFRDTAGNYSQAEAASFYVTGYAADAGRINAIEYFIDADPGAGKGKALAAGSVTDTLRRTYNIKLAAGIKAGTHYIGVRTRNTDGKWSLYTVDTFTVTAAGLALTSPMQETDMSQANESQLLVFPNPATDIIHVALKHSSSYMIVAIYDLSGHVLKSFKTTANKVTRVPVSDLIPGTYIVKTSDGTTIRSATFIKQ